MKTTALTCVVIMLLTASAFGQTGTVINNHDKYVGVVDGKDVRVRSAPNVYSQICTTISSPTRVNVVGRRGDWLRIQAVKGCFSVVDKRYVKLDATGKVGTITASSVWIYAAGERLTRIDDQIQTGLKADATVTILGSVGKYYKINPPADDAVIWWVSAKYIKPAPAGVAVEVVKEDPAIDPESLPATDPEADPATDPANVIKPPVKVDPENVIQARAALKEAESLLKAQYAKPFQQRDIDAVLAKYKAIPDLPETRIDAWKKTRIVFLETALVQRKQLQKINDIVKQSASEQQKLKELRAKLDIAPTVIPRTAYAAEGVLVASVMYTGKAGQPKLFLLRDTETKRIAAYVQCPAGTVDLDKYVGKHIGIFGNKTFSKSLKRSLVDAFQVKIINDDPNTPKRTKSSVIVPKPLPKPKKIVRPKPAPKVTPKVKPKVKPQADKKDEPKAEPKKSEPPKIIPAPKPETKTPKVEKFHRPEFKEPDDEPAKVKVDPPAKIKTSDTAKTVKAEDLPKTGLPQAKPDDDDKTPSSVDEHKYR